MQVGRENPSELKAAKLARSMARGVEDRDLKPNTKERQQIEAVIVAPPNRHALCWHPSALLVHAVISSPDDLTNYRARCICPGFSAFTCAYLPDQMQLLSGRSK